MSDIVFTNDPVPEVQQDLLSDGLRAMLEGGCEHGYPSCTAMVAKLICDVEMIVSKQIGIGSPYPEDFELMTRIIGKILSEKAVGESKNIYACDVVLSMLKAGKFQDAREYVWYYMRTEVNEIERQYNQMAEE